MVFNFDGIVAELQAKLSLLSNWRKTLYHGTYQRIIEMVAYVLDKLVYFTEVLYRESSWKYAQIKSSLIQKSSFLGYVPYRSTGAYGNIILSADSTFSTTYVYTGESVVIPRWTEFTNTAANVNVYSTEEKIYYKNTVGNLTVPVKEGTPKSYIYVANGDVEEIITIYSDVTDDDEIEVFIVDANDEVLYTVTIVSDLYFVENTTTYSCEVNNAEDFSNIQIKFGDGITAKKLSFGDRVLIKYADTQGVDGNIENTSTVIVIKSTLVDANDDAAVLYVTNEESISDGSGPEDIESIRENAPNLFETGQRCGNYQDWITILESYSSVHKAIIWTEEDLGNETIGADQNKIYAAAISATGDDLTTAQKNEISTAIDEEKSPTEILVWENLDTIYLKWEVIAKVQDNSFTVITQQIKDKLQDNYGTLNVEFKQNIYESGFSSKLMELEDIIYHETEVWYMEKNFAASTSAYTIKVSYTSSDTTNPEDQVYLHPDSVEVWLKRKIAGTWQDAYQAGYESSGYIWGMVGHTFTGTNVDHENNEITFSFLDIIMDPMTYGVRDPEDSDPTGYLIHLMYKTQDGYGYQSNNIRLTKFYHITAIDEEFTYCTLSYM